MRFIVERYILKNIMWAGPEIIALEGCETAGWRGNSQDGRKPRRLSVETNLSDATRWDA